MEKKIGIYLIKNTLNNRGYVGLSKDIFDRWKDHDSKLRNQNHENVFLQRDYDRCGSKHFIKEVLEFCSEEQLVDKEIHWGKVLQDQGIELYNVAELGGIPPLCTPESIKKAIETRKKNKVGVGVKLSETHKKKLSEKRTGKSNGDNNGMAKLTWEIVNAIRKEYKEEETSARILAKKYNITKSNVLFIIHNETWFDETYFPPKKNESQKKVSFTLENHPSLKLSWEQVIEMRKLYNAKQLTMKELAYKFGITLTYTSNILNNKVWKEI